MSPPSAERRPGPGAAGEQHTECTPDSTVLVHARQAGPADPALLAVALVQLAETDPTHPLLAAVRAAVEMIDLRREWRRDEVESTRAVSAAARRELGPGWASRRVPHDEIQRRRYPPNGDRDEWIQAGPS